MKMPFNSLRSKTLLWTAFPAVLLLAAVVAVTPRFLEEMAKTVAQQRDVELARISAYRLAAELTYCSLGLQRIAAGGDLQKMDQAAADTLFVSAGADSYMFDAGIVLYDDHGEATWCKPAAMNRMGELFPAAGEFDTLRASLRPVFSDIFNDDRTGEDVIMVAVPIVRGTNVFTGALAGFATVKYSSLGAMYARLLEFKQGRSGYAYLVDGGGRVIYHRDPSQVGRRMKNTHPVGDVIRGRTGSTVLRLEGGETVIVGYAPVPSTHWGLVTQETWDVIIGPIRRDRALLLTMLVIGGIAAGIVTLMAVSRILRPIRDLSSGAERIASGDFEYRINARTGDEIQVLSQQFNNMAEALKRSYHQLELRVEERTRDLAGAKEKAIRAEKAKSAFIASMSHELRTPLNSIIGFTGMVLKGAAGPVNDEQRKQLTTAYRSAQHLLSLINDVLDLSKMEAGKLTITKTEFDLATLVERVAQTVAPMAVDKRIKLTTSVPPGIPPVFSDERRVEQILLNLVNNAIKFTDSGSVRIEAAWNDKANETDISVTDTGIGIRPEDMGKLFQDYRQLEGEKQARREGTGLGLVICDRMAGLLGGRMYARSVHGKGSTFGLVIPLEANGS